MADMTLAQKLGIKPELAAYVLHAPTAYEHELSVAVVLVTFIKQLPQAAGWVQAFYMYQDDLSRDIAALKKKLAKGGQLWICWPKRTSGSETDLSDTFVRALG